MNPAKTFKYGNKRLQVFYVDDDGYPIGLQSDGTIVQADDAAVGETYHAYTVGGYVSATPAAREEEVATDQADGKNYGDITMGITAYGSVEITLSQRDEVFFDMMSGATATGTVSSGMYITSPNNTSITPRLMGMIITDRVRDEVTGVPQYEHKIYNKGTFTVTQEAEGNQGGGVNPSTLTVTFKPQPSERFVATGMTYTAMGLNVDEGTETHSIIRSEYQVTLTTFIKDGTEDEFTTQYKPVVAGATVGGVNVFSTEGVQAALTSLSVTTGVAVMTAPGTSGHRAVLLHATNFVEV